MSICRKAVSRALGPAYIIYMARRRFFVNQVHAGRAHIVGEEAHHLTRVLRVERGQRFEISDNCNVYLAEIEMARKDLVSFTIVEQLAPVEPAVSVAVFASLIKFERFEWLLEKATELGVEAITPVQAERTEKGLERAAVKRVARWQKIVREASEQSRRVRMPQVNAPVLLTEAIRVWAEHRYVLDEYPHTPAMLSELPASRSDTDTVALLIGPEGGWTDRERTTIAESGWRPVGLGGTILRAETAAIAAIAIVNAAWQEGGTGLLRRKP
jgi:16S rRNA (uracil1498-N3)-methyltransferase